MTVTIICKEPFPKGLAGTQRIICYAKALMASGIPCRVVVFKRTESANAVRNECPDGTFEGIPYCYVGGTTIKPSHKIMRLACEWSDRLKLLGYIRKDIHSGDIVIGYLNDDLDFMLKVIDKIHSKGARYVRELCEIPYFGRQDKRSVIGLKRTLSELFPKCDGFISISDSLYQLAEEHKSPDALVLKIPILVDYGKIAVEDKSDEAVIPYIFHAGTLTEQKDGILGMVEAFGRVRAVYGKTLKMICTGDFGQSPERDRIKELIEKYNLGEDLVFTGFIDRDEVVEYLSRASLTIINKRPNPQNFNCFSTKLADYLAAGKPVIITDVGEAKNWLEDGKDAIIVNWCNEESLCEAVFKLLSDREYARRIGERGRETCRRCFDYRNVIRSLNDFMMKL